MYLPGTAPQTEVLIAGAGPAGLACAIASARQGLQVDVVEAAGPSIDKACGEGLMPDSLAALEAIGVHICPHHTETALLRGIHFLDEQPHREHSPIAEAAFPARPGRGIRRTVLHQVLLDRAISLGVRFHWDNSLREIRTDADGSTVRTSRQTLRTRYLIGADGLRSRVATEAGLTDATIHSRRIGLRQHYTIAPWTDFVEVYWSDHGQAYVTPISANEVCVAFIAHKKTTAPEQVLRHFPALGRRLAAAVVDEAPRGAVTLNRSLRRVTTTRVALIGDASGSVDAVTGEGLFLCFRQAAALSQALQAGDLSLYQREHRRIRLAASLMSRSLLLMDRSPRLRAHAIQTFERCPILFRRLLEVHIGHRACILPGVDEWLASGLHVLTS